MSSIPPHKIFKSPTPANILKQRFEKNRQQLINGDNYNVAIDPITIVINECMVISSAMRKVNRWSQSGVAAILGGNDIFSDDKSLSSSLGLSNNLSNNQSQRNSNDNPLLSSFLQLRSILTEAKNINDIDGLTILQPFLLVIKSSSTSGHITSLSLDSISKFLNYDIISTHSKNLQTSLIQIISSLTHCRFEAADQNSDDAVLLKVLRLMESVLNSDLSNYLPNEIVSEVIQTCLSLACNKKRSEVLRKAAEMTISLITARVFKQLHLIEPESNVEELKTDFTGNKLPEDIIGSANANTSVTDLQTSETEKSEEVEEDSEDTEKVDEDAKEEKDTETEEPFGIGCLNDFMGILISMISPHNQYQHMESTRVLALNLINTAIEVSGKDIPNHHSLMMLIADPVSKHVLSIITKVDSPPLLQASLKLFTTMAIVLGEHLKSQIELTLTLLFNSILPPAVNEEKKNDALKGNQTSINNRLPSSKEMMIESLSLMWIREPQFFANLFIDFDCEFDKSDLCKQLIEFICKLTLPESARITTDNVPPICLEGLLSFISGINERVKLNPDLNINDSKPPKLILNKKNKNLFIKCTDIFNKKPSQGIKALFDEGFLKDENDIKEIAEFIYNKSGRLNKKVLGEFLGKSSNKELLKYFIELFDFEGLRVDEALRVLLKSFRLPGESQQIERIVELFGERYAKCQENFESQGEEEFIKPDSDSVFVLSYSIIILNTDLHSPQVKKQMTFDAYKRNLKGTYNNGDYPEWYLNKIYGSIRDREIIMPEEHHGTDKWFDDAWHNLISSNNFSTNNFITNDLSSPMICCYDKYLFEETVDTLIDTIINVFKEATDDHIITRLMSSIDKCVNICLFYDIQSPIDKLIGLLADLTFLTSKVNKLKDIEDSNVRDEIPITQIKIDKKEDAITVSEMAVWFGRDFKAQISTVVLFRLIKKTDCRITKSWDKILRIILTLFENCFINPNLFTGFQNKLKLPQLPKVKPRYIINRSKPLKDSGILSTFSSLLKGYSDEPPEPTDQEVESTLSSIDCIKSLNIPAVFRIISQNGNEDKKMVVQLLLDMLPELNDETKRYYEIETLFILEILICFVLLINEDELIGKVLEKINAINVSEVSKKSSLRITTYKLLLIRNSEVNIDTLNDIFKGLMGNEKEFLTKNGSQIIQPLISLVDEDSWCCKKILVNEDFWKFLRLLGSIPIFANSILQFTESIVKYSSNDITGNNFMLVLGLLDEISSLGASGSQLEQETDSKIPEDQKADNNEYLKELVELSKKSIGLTCEMTSIITKEGFNSENGGYPLIQALAHQCFNPCREVRSFALGSLRSTTMSTIDNLSDLKPFKVFEYGLFPLLGELSKSSVIQTDPIGFVNTQMDALSLVSKVFLHYLTTFDKNELSTVWLGILNYFQIFNDIREKSNHSDNLIKESGIELIKNMLLVLETSEILVESDQELWSQTWEKVNKLYPELKDLAVSNTTEVTPEKSEPESKDKEPEIKSDDKSEAESKTELNDGSETKPAMESNDSQQINEPEVE
ncbi:ARF guanine-nucleotide exchange factor 2 [[Candida] jaroonii]|uniref:ARF guanine-nucleotide exchange factor 2 n=1 Tax=[Candida] jaroonii TaxID=467808 RepID=A0ACA9YCM9_9ASCO|nr:ARF guanine-nucleotide exchange factor 2 [[Candida] jaroonii]